MAKTKTDPETEPEEPETEEEESEEDDDQQLRAMIKEIVTEVIGDRSPQAKRTPQNQKAADIASEVEAAIERVGKKQEEEKSKKSDADWKKSVDEKLAEKPPIQRRRIHHVMKWGE